MHYGIRLWTIPDQHRRDRPAPGRQSAQTHERVPAVVPGADQGNDGALGEQTIDDECSLSARILHERGLGNPALVNGDPVVAGSLCRGGRTHHRFPEPPAQAVRAHGYL